MTPAERRAAIVDIGLTRELYTVEKLHRALYETGEAVDIDNLYAALKASGWVKLWLIRERLLELKRAIPKRHPYDGIRKLVKEPLGIDRHRDIPGWPIDRKE